MTHSKVQTIDVHELRKLQELNRNLTLIDVREIHEWEEQRIPGALHIPKDNLAATIASVISDKNHPIYLHCRGGTRSLWAGERLVEMGYTEVYSVNGGISDWCQSGYPVKD